MLFYNKQETVHKLGIPLHELNLLVEAGKLQDYRDVHGSNFKRVDVDKLAGELHADKMADLVNTKIPEPNVVNNIVVPVLDQIANPACSFLDNFHLRPSQWARVAVFCTMLTMLIIVLIFGNIGLPWNWLIGFPFALLAFHGVECIIAKIEE